METNQEQGDDLFSDWNISSIVDGTNNCVQLPAVPQHSGHVRRVPERWTYGLGYANGGGI